MGGAIGLSGAVRGRGDALEGGRRGAPRDGASRTGWVSRGCGRSPPRILASEEEGGGLNLPPARPFLTTPGGESSLPAGEKAAG